MDDHLGEKFKKHKITVSNDVNLMQHTEPPAAAMMENCVVMRWGRRQRLTLPLCYKAFRSGALCMIMLMVSYLSFYLSRDSVFLNKALSQHWWPLCPKSADCQSDNVAYSPGPRDSVFVNKAQSQHWGPLSPSSPNCQNDGLGSLCCYRLQICEGYVFTSVCHSVHRERSASRGLGGWADPPSIGYYGIRSTSRR